MSYYHNCARAQSEKERLEDRPDEAAKMDCWRCGRKIRDAEYLVTADGLAYHFCCPVGAK